eukprot:gene8770-biopygen9197
MSCKLPINVVDAAQFLPSHQCGSFSFPAPSTHFQPWGSRALDADSQRAGHPPPQKLRICPGSSGAPEVGRYCLLPRSSQMTPNSPGVRHLSGKHVTVHREKTNRRRPRQSDHAFTRCTYTFSKGARTHVGLRMPPPPPPPHRPAERAAKRASPSAGPDNAKVKHTG